MTLIQHFTGKIVSAEKVMEADRLYKRANQLEWEFLNNQISNDLRKEASDILDNELKSVIFSVLYDGITVKDIRQPISELNDTTKYALVRKIERIADKIINDCK